MFVIAITKILAKTFHLAKKPRKLRLYTRIVKIPDLTAAISKQFDEEIQQLDLFSPDKTW
ncbi:hypothetical protein SK128_008924, partial [Halocaridina rubra]